MARIAAVARASFAARGWAGTTLRGVAREAGVDPALVHYYFSSKEELLDACTTPPQQWVQSLQLAGAQPLEHRGGAIVAGALRAWSDPEIRATLSSILMTAAHEPRTREKLQGFVTTSLSAAAATELEDGERILRASLAASQLIGVAMLRWVWAIEPIASLPDERLVTLVGPSVQRYLSGRLG